MLFKKSITKQQVTEMREHKPLRRRFSDYPVVLPAAFGVKFSTPFRNGIVPLFERETGVRVRLSQYGYWQEIPLKPIADKCLEWQSKFSNLIFLRDNLDISIALEENLVDVGRYTNLGFLENDAKNNRNIRSAMKIAAFMATEINKICFYKEADFVCAVPPSLGKKYDLPSILSDHVGKLVGKKNISSLVRFTKEKESVKAVNLDQKWDILESGAIEVSINLEGKSIILIDDKYQSGNTIQYVASKLYDAGAANVYGLCAVKTRRDTDNM